MNDTRWTGLDVLKVVLVVLVCAWLFYSMATDDRVGTADPYPYVDCCD
jgi:hypothetical protein